MLKKVSIILFITVLCISLLQFKSVQAAGIVSYEGFIITTITASVSNFDTSGNLYYRGVDMAIFQDEDKDGVYAVKPGKVTRVLTGNTSIEVSLGDPTDYLEDGNKYKVGYRVIYSPIDDDTKLLIDDQSNGKDGWKLIQEDGADIWFAREDPYPPTVGNGMDEAIRYTNAADGTNMRFNTTNGADTGGSGYDATYFWCRIGSAPWFIEEQRGIHWSTNNWYVDIPIQGEGTYLTRAYPRDNAGNWNWNSYVDERYVVDRQAPNAPTIISSRQGMGKTDVSLSLLDNGDNGEAGVAYMQIKMDEDSWLTYSGEWKNGDPWGLSVEGLHTVSAKAVDKAGNVSETSTITYGIDTTPPTISLTPSTIEPTSDAVTITATASDDESGVNRIQLPSGALVYAESATFPVSNNGTYTFYAWDNADNQSTRSIVVSNINTPSIPLTGNGVIFDSAEEAAKAGYYPDPKFK